MRIEFQRSRTPRQMRGINFARISELIAQYFRHFLEETNSLELSTLFFLEDHLDIAGVITPNAFSLGTIRFFLVLTTTHERAPFANCFLELRQHLV